MNYTKITDHDQLAAAAKTSGKNLVDWISFAWDEDLCLRGKWNHTLNKTKELHMKETCFMIDDEQIELLHPIMEEEPKCQVTFGQGNLETLFLVLKFKLSDTKITGTIRTYSPSKPCKSFPYELFLKDIEFEIMAGLIIRGNSFYIENFCHNYLNFNITLSYKNKDESKEIFPLDKIQDITLRNSIEKYIMDKFTKDIIIAVEDTVDDICANPSVTSLLDDKMSYRNKLRLHQKRVTATFQKLFDEIKNMLNKDIEDKKLSEINLPDIYGKLLEKDKERGHFRASEGSLKCLSSLQEKLDHIAVYNEGEDIILFVFLYFSCLDIVYKHLSIHRKDSEHTRSFETPENSNSSFMKIRIKKLADEKYELILDDFKVNDLGYIEVNWDESKNNSLKKVVEPEFAMWLNYTLEYKVPPVIEETIKGCLNEILKDEKLIPLFLNPQNIDDECDSDYMNDKESNDEMEDESESK